MKRKIIALIAMLLVVSMLLPSCKKDGDDSETTDSDVIAETTETDEIEVQTCVVTDVDGVETIYEILGTTEIDGIKYYALAPFESEETSDSGDKGETEEGNQEKPKKEYVIYRAEKDADGNDNLFSIEEKEELDRVTNVFKTEVFEEETETIDPIVEETTAAPEPETTAEPVETVAPDTTVVHLETNIQQGGNSGVGGGSLDIGQILGGTTSNPNEPEYTIDTIIPLEYVTTNSGKLLIHTISDRTTNRYDDTSNSLSFVLIKDPNATVNWTAEQNRQKVNLATARPGATYNGVLIGYDNYLFYKDTLNDFIGNGVLATSLYNKAVEDLKARNNWVEAHGKKFYFVIAPNKNTVYPDYMPEGYTLASYRRYDQFVELLSEAGITAVDLRETMAKAVKERPQENLYYKYDTHWNNHAGYYAYRTAMDLIDNDFPNVIIHDRSEYQINYTETYMKDLCWYTGNYDRVTDYGPVYTLKSGKTAILDWVHKVPKRDDWGNIVRDDWGNPIMVDDAKSGQYQFSYIDSQGYSDRLVYFRYVNNYNKNAPNIYVMRDSYSIALVPFMKDSFYKSTFNWTWSFSEEEILRSEADVVMVVVAERNLRNYVNNKAVSD